MGRFIILIIISLGAIFIGRTLYADAPQLPDALVQILPTKQLSNKTLTISWVGDMVPSDDIAYNSTVFAGVTDLLQKPDVMIGNLEGTFANPERPSKCDYGMTQCYAFRGDISFLQSLQGAGFDVVSLTNNHSYDFGIAGLEDTKTALQTAGIPYVSSDEPTSSITVKGVRIGILGLSSTKPWQTITDYDFITKQVTNLKKDNDLVIVLFHGGAEGADKTTVPNAVEYMGDENRGDVRRMAHTAVDAGADLVFGAGPHVLRPVETYRGKTIAYSLGNFVGGNGRLQTSGILGKSAILTTSFTLKKDGTAIALNPLPWQLTPIQLTAKGVPQLPTETSTQ